MSYLSMKRPCPIGVDMAEDVLKFAQLNHNGNGIDLIAGGSEELPSEIKSCSPEWQKWAVEIIGNIMEKGLFKGRDIIATMPSNQIFVDNMKMPKSKSSEKVGIGAGILSKLKDKLPFDSSTTLIQHIPTEEDNMLVMACDRQVLEKHLAIYEKANLNIMSMSAWPLALSKSYASFFCRRKGDDETIVMLLNIEQNCTNLVVCRADKPLFVRYIPTGLRQLEDEEVITRLMLDLTNCQRQFSSTYKNSRIERLVFMSGTQSTELGNEVFKTEVCKKIAEQFEIPAQMGDCLVAIEAANPYQLGIDRQSSQFSWATAFGLSLS